MLKKNQLTGVEIRKKLTNDFGLNIGRVTSYRVLYLLERNGYVTRTEKKYRITQKGRAEIKKGKKVLEEILRILGSETNK